MTALSAVCVKNESRTEKMRKLSKKEKIIIIIAAVTVLIAVALLAFFPLYQRSGLNSPDKAKAMSDAVWISEGSDCLKLGSSDAGQQLPTFEQAAQKAAELGFDTVFLKSEYLYDKSLKAGYKSGSSFDIFSRTAAVDAEKLGLIRSACEKLSSLSVKAVVSVDIASFDSVIASVAGGGFASGLIVTGCSGYPAETVNERLKAITSAVKGANPSLAVYADFDSVENLSSVIFDEQHMTCCVAELYAEHEDLGAYIENFASRLENSGVSLAAGFRCERVCNEKYSLNADELLRQIVAADSCPKVTSRSFHSLSDFNDNRENSAQTALEYIRNGLDLSKTLTQLELDGHNEQNIQTESETYSFKVRCSDKFPVYINGYAYGAVGENFCSITVDLRHGENEITVRQNGKTISFTVNCTKEFTGELVSFITPSDTAYYSGKQTVQITVGAFYQAKLRAKLGDKELELKPLGTSSGDYSVFSASVKLPKSGKKLRDMGKVVVEASFNGVSKTYTGGNILVNAKSNSVTVSAGADSQLAQPHTSYQQQITVTGRNLTPYTDNGAAGTGNFIMVSAPTAETFPTDPNSSYYDPTYCLWTQGTIDRVVGESEYTNGDGDTFGMYNLASGRRIVKEDVAYIPSGYNLPDNTAGIVSSDGGNGLDITISTLWRVPYAVNRYNQDYYIGYEGKKFNVVNHTVSVIDLVFYNTPSHSGKADIAQNPIVEKAEWVADAANGTSILRFYLKKQGGFYGCSVTYDRNGNMHMKFKQPTPSLSGKTIIIDPGHGGVQSGATGRNGTVYESHQTLKIGKYLAGYLSQSGAAVYMTRTEDIDVSLEARRRMTEQINPDLFVSVHLNASENKSRSGTCSFYYRAFSMPLAKCIHNRLVEAYKTSCYQTDARMYAAIDNGANYYPFYVTRTDVCPSALVEVGFITNDLECAYLIDDAYQQVFAYAIYCGIADYVSSVG